MGNLINQAQSAYNIWKEANMPVDVSGWSNMSDADALKLWKTDQEYQQAIKDAQDIETAFFAARAEAFSTFETTKQSEFVALQMLWQTKEDHDFDVDYTE